MTARPNTSKVRASYGSGRTAYSSTCRSLCALLLSFSAAGQITADEHAHRFDTQWDVLGFMQTNQHTGEDTWLNGGLGHYALGDGEHPAAMSELQLGYRYKANGHLSFFTHVQARVTTDQDSARHLGLIELKARYHTDLDFNQSVRFTAGQFFLPISMENTERFWDSPYTLSFSSLNSWIGEEFRPIGVDGSYLYHFDSGLEWELAATLFGGNDSMGALLAYRGWSYGRHRTMFDDVLAVPNLKSLDDGGMFEGQRDDGSKPFGRDLDNRPGYALRTSLSLDQYLLSVTWVDNMGDTQLHHGEYAWRTRFAILGGSWIVTDQLELLAEGSVGNTTMGAAPGVDADFYSGYLMASYLFDDLRLSARYDLFGMDDRDDIDNDNNDFGRSYTLALMWQPEDSNLRLGLEGLYLHSKRIKTLSANTPSDSEQFTSSDSFVISMLASYRF